MPTLGIIADTHVPRRLARLPDSVHRVFSGVDLILHAGDLDQRRVLDELGQIAPTLAVRGNADLFGFGLPARRVIEIGGRRIGLIHGHGGWLRYLWRKGLDVFGFNNNAYIHAAHAAFANDRVDAVVFGHTHRPCHLLIEGVLMFNPGSVAPDYYVTPGPQVGLMYVEPDRLEARVIEL